MTNILIGFVFGFFISRIYAKSENRIKENTDKVHEILQHSYPNEYLEMCYDILEDYQKKRFLGIIPLYSNTVPVKEMDDIEFMALCKSYNDYVEDNKFSIFSFPAEKELDIEFLIKIRNSLTNSVERLKKNG